MTSQSGYSRRLINYTLYRHPITHVLSCIIILTIVQMQYIKVRKSRTVLVLELAFLLIEFPLNQLRHNLFFQAKRKVADAVSAIPIQDFSPFQLAFHHLLQYLTVIIF